MAVKKVENFRYKYSSKYNVDLRHAFDAERLNINARATAPAISLSENIKMRYKLPRRALITGER